MCFLDELLQLNLKEKEQKEIMSNPFVQQFQKLIEKFEDKNDKVQWEQKQYLFDDDQKQKVY